ncbi:MAG: PIN domain-containing protein [Thermoleophilia bacterium]|nr:PIN domain-containing protein [Thermoleophilia bacterium]
MGALRPTELLIDTSVFVALEQGRIVADLPEDRPWQVSVVTIGELHRGVIAATDDGIRAQRLATYREVIEHFEPVPIDETVAITWGEYEHLAAVQRRSTGEADSWIAATAATHGLTLVTQNRGFEWFPDLDVLVV